MINKSQIDIALNDLQHSVVSSFDEEVKSKKRKVFMEDLVEKYLKEGDNKYDSFMLGLELWVI